MSRVTDGARGLWIDQGHQWFGVNGERLNVREFGATGSGITDDTTAIQSAINAAGTGDAIIFPNGTYLVTGLAVTRRITLMGWGGATLRANNSTRGTTLLAISAAADEALVTGLRFAGNDLNPEAVRIVTERLKDAAAGEKPAAADPTYQPDLLGLSPSRT